MRWVVLVSLLMVGGVYIASRSIPAPIGDTSTVVFAIVLGSLIGAWDRSRRG